MVEVSCFSTTTADTINTAKPCRAACDCACVCYFYLMFCSRRAVVTFTSTCTWDQPNSALNERDFREQPHITHVVKAPNELSVASARNTCTWLYTSALVTRSLHRDVLWRVIVMILSVLYNYICSLPVLSSFTDIYSQPDCSLGNWVGVLSAWIFCLELVCFTSTLLLLAGSSFGLSAVNLA